MAHLASWLPLITGAVRLLRHPWRPIGDEAAIALRSWDALTSHGPLVGQATRLAHGVFDPGPLEYWLLAIPVHLDPDHGVLWGAVLCGLAACSITVEAAWAAGGPAAGLGASGLIAGLFLWIPGVALLPSWNPWFGMMAFVAALAAGWAVLAGHRRWWPALVITASVAAQAHLMFALASAALAVLALLVGLADTVRARSGYWWVLTGVLAGAGCWSAPAVQQLTMPHGNIAALIDNAGSNGPGTGVTFGLRALTAAIEPPPLWWKPVPGAAVIVAQIGGRPSGFAVAALILLAAVGIAAAWPLRCRWLCALTGVSLLVSLAALATYSSIPVHYTSLHALSYLILLLFPVGTLSWIVIGSAAVLVAGPAARRLGPGAAGTGTAVITAGGIAVCALAVAQQPPAARNVADESLMREALAAARQIERVLPSQRLAMAVRDYHHRAALGRLALGISWALTPSGYYPKLISTRLARELGSSYVYRGGRMPLVTIVFRHRVVLVEVARQAPAGRSAARRFPGAGGCAPANVPELSRHGHCVPVTR